ncbi:helix-turn-helix domain-containing protein [Streptomyces sp. NPDC053048]|uniref:helix-turn-helix domain-containing protein n=1 Tax=Streptomyces sp. NPDC053048 TaxID=3365694 RepID=UPI0037D78CB2
MPRRLSHLDSKDGPLPRFALELRALRDAAGFDAPTVDQIAARSRIPRSTLYAALRGRRVPTRPVLGALVRAWGGDPAEWLMKRTAVEAELEAARGARPVGTAQPPVLPAPPVATPVPTVAADFAAGLLQLRMEAGYPSLRQIAEKIRRNDELPAKVGVSTLSDIFRGKGTPSWGVLRGVVWALEGNEREWQERWLGLRRALYEGE